ncbi:protein patched homolog 1-like [Actinia tenebrosa]|uniref:Protein patched homolog 1-like n=1 Tax=Actinia tenebrosa TaxID=6105 RepID=A0A6P8H4X9_ACTTE|nr:protein patched homolog 1-like [Actinia tenebrosa]
MSGSTPENYTWAREVLQDIDEGRARGNRLALKIRSRIQSALFSIGCLSQRHCGKIVLFGFLVMSIFAIGLSRAKLETNAEKLWVEAGGRLERELRYTEAALGKEFGSTQEIVIQTPNSKGTNILTVEAMLLHQKALKQAAKLKVHVANRDWSLKDLCYAPSFPLFYNSMLGEIMHHLIPCTIITPMDCFWEGAKVHGPEIDMTLPDDSQRSYLKWTDLNPIDLLNKIQESFSSWEMKKFRTLFKEAGITTGYLEKPCLNPKDPGCPRLAPNFHSKEVPDIGAELTGGCHGFAAKFMEWPEEIIVGGVIKNRSGTIRSASALQSVVLLMGVNNLYDYHQDRYWKGDGSYKWNVDIAREVLETWQKNFTKVMNEVTDETEEEFSILAFTSASFNELLKDFSKTSTVRLAMGYVLMLIYSGLTLKKWNNAVQSQGALGVAGVVLVTVAVVSGLGFCTFCGIAFNASSTQVLPFLALGLGVDDMFLLAHTYASISERGEIHPSDQVGYTLGRTGVSIFLTSFNNMVAFLMAVIIPIPALRAFSFQAAVIVMFNYFAIIIVFPAMIAIDVKRKRDQRYDLCCCIQRDVPQRISITPSSTTDSAMVLRRFHNSCSSLSSVTNSGVNAGAVVLPGNMQATALGTVSLPGAVTVQASAVAEISNGGNSVCNTILPLSVSGLNSQDILTVSAGDGRTAVGAGCRVERSTLREHPTDTNIDVVVPNRTNTVRYDNKEKPKKHVSRNNNVNTRTIEHNSRPVGRSSDQSLRDSSRNSSHNKMMDSKWVKMKKKLRVLSLAYFAKHYYGPFLQKPSTKTVVILLFIAMLVAGAYGCLLVRDGLDLTDLVPKNSTEHKFVTAQYMYFSFYSIFAVTMKNFDYSKEQNLMYEYHDAFKRVSNVLKTPEMELQPFWLMYFRDWLKDVQTSFDEEWASGTITYSGWYENASDSGILGYKMLAQTGNENYPVNRSQVRSVRLVDDQGIIRPQVFYHYLTVWYNVDTMGYTASQGNVRPKPSNWNNNRDSKEPRNMKIEPAEPLEFSQLPFYLVNMKDTADFVKVIKEVREICDEFKEKGLSTYPSGIPFTFWEQYVWLRHNLFIAIIVILAVSFIVMVIVLCNLWAAAIIVLALTLITVQVFGFMGLTGIKLSAVPAVTLILSVGVGVEFTVHMCLAFLSATGEKNIRMQKAIEQVFSPVLDGAVSTFLGVVMLAGSDFDFIVRYFFHLLCALIVIGVTNGLVLLPVFLSMAGPAPEVEAVRPPGTASSAGSQRELLPVSSCRRGTPPTDSQVCILDTSGYHNSKQDDKTDNSRHHHRKRPRGERHYNRRVHASNANKSNSSPRASRVTYDLESSSSVVARVTATATVTVQVHAEQIPNERTICERVQDNVQSSSHRSTQAAGQIQYGEITIEDLEEHTQVK